MAELPEAYPVTSYSLVLFDIFGTMTCTIQISLDNDLHWFDTAYARYKIDQTVRLAGKQIAGISS